MLADGLTKILNPKIFKDFQRMIRMIWAGHIQPSKSIEICHKTD